ncbi:hypothetical protein TNCV_1997451 [Trichonephila clavipes]|uniref:Uncharacterized protein n=1 Tax=Trichonephila clavipes TaxID=2585209 RepID=A0A8X6RLA5_TRICX|nr:hypothetical protein TNCV_1997451 [Trichonephila clavipes]
MLDEHYQKISNVDFSKIEGSVKRRASNIVHGCRGNTNHGNPVFTTDFSMHELGAALRDTNLRKSPCPDGIHGSMIDHLRDGRRRTLKTFLRYPTTFGTVILKKSIKG